MTIKENCIPLESPDEWREALKGIPHTFGHTWENCYAMHLTTHLKTVLYYFETEDMRIVCPFDERHFNGHTDITKPFGFSGFVSSGDCREFSNYWKEFVRRKGYICGYLGLNPIFSYGSSFDKNEIYQYDSIYALDLTPDADDLLANMSMNRKRQLRDWDKVRSNLTIEKSALSDFFLSNYVDFFQRKDAASFYFFSRDTLSFLFNLDNVLIVGAPNLEKVEAISVFTYTAHAGSICSMCRSRKAGTTRPRYFGMA